MTYIRVVKPVLYSSARPLRSCEQSLLAISRSNLKTRGECDFSSVVFGPRTQERLSTAGKLAPCMLPFMYFHAHFEVSHYKSCMEMVKLTQQKSFHARLVRFCAVLKKMMHKKGHGNPFAECVLASVCIFPYNPIML